MSEDVCIIRISAFFASSAFNAGLAAAFRLSAVTVAIAEPVPAAVAEAEGEDGI